MKTLILLRHGKSDWSGEVSDHERPINERGRKAAVRMADWMRGEGLTPDHMLVSSATRTRETAVHLRSALGDLAADVAQVPLDALYLADPGVVLETVRTKGKGETLLVLGHNPGLETAAVKLTRGVRCPPAMPTCTAAVLRFAVRSWGDVGWGEGMLVHHVAPKSLD